MGFPEMHYYHFKTLIIGYPRPISFVIRVYCNGATIRTENHPVTNFKFPYRTQVNAERQVMAWCDRMNGLPAVGASARSYGSRETVQ